MKIRILRSFMVSQFAGYEPGQVIDANGGVADYWIRRGLAEEVKDDENKPKTKGRVPNAHPSASSVA